MSKCITKRSSYRRESTISSIIAVPFPRTSTLLLWIIVVTRLPDVLPLDSLLSGRDLEFARVMKTTADRNIPPCAACHRPGSGGPIETPILAEEVKEYIVAQVKMYAS